MIQIFDTLSEYNNYTSNDENLSSGILYYIKEDGSGHFFTNNIDGENKIYDLCSGGSSDEFKEFIEGTAEVINIPNGTTIIGDYTFYTNPSIKTVVIPNSVESIGDFVFYNTGLSSLTIPNSVKNIGTNIVANSSRLTSVTIGAGVINIKGNAFSYCSNLATAIVLAETPPTIIETWGSYAIFDYAASDFVIYVPAASVDAYKAASGWSTYADKIQAIPE